MAGGTVAAHTPNRLMKLILAGLSEAMAAEGFNPIQPPDGRGEAGPTPRNPLWRQAWFVADSGVPGVKRVIKAHLQRDTGIDLSGTAYLMADVVEEVRAELPTESLEGAGLIMPRCVETVSFGHFQYPQCPDQATIWIAIESDVDYCVRRFMDDLHGSVQPWFAQRASLTGLLALGPKPNLTHWDRSNPDPVRLRAVVILALDAGHTEEAVALMKWYRVREQFNAWDSQDRVTAFDAAMAVRFPGFAASSAHQ
ncbi:hypothetical protein [Nocardia tengchongensis]|uniref:hypothetical protein n=1 Tax=Nocardia tengchongensis TaxID=2055889 RepID=UPI0036C95345